MNLNIPIPDEVIKNVLSIPMPSFDGQNDITESQLLNIPIPVMPPTPVSSITDETSKEQAYKSDFNLSQVDLKEIELTETQKVTLDSPGSGSPVPVKISLLSADAARRRLQAFSIQKKLNALPPVNNSSPPKPVLAAVSVSSPVLIGKKIQGSKMVSAFHKPVVDVFSEADEKKRKTLVRPHSKKGLSEYEKSRLKLRTLESSKDHDIEKMALAKIGVPLGMVPVGTSVQPLPMPSKAMPPLKKMLKPEEVESLIHKAKTLKEGEQFQYTIPKFTSDDEIVMKPTNLNENNGNKSKLSKGRDMDRKKFTDHYRRDRSRRDHTHRTSRRYESKYRYDSTSSSLKKNSSKEADVNMEDFIVCDSWSMDTDPSNKEDSCNDNLSEEVHEKINPKDNTSQEEIFQPKQDDSIKNNVLFSDIREASPHSDTQQKLTNLEFLKTAFRSDSFKSVVIENIPEPIVNKPVDVSGEMVYLSGPAAYTAITCEIYSPPASSHDSGNEDAKSERNKMADVDLLTNSNQNTDLVQSLKKESLKENIFYSPGMVSSRESTPIVLPLGKPKIKDILNDRFTVDVKNKEKSVDKLDRKDSSKPSIDEVWKDIINICEPKKHTDKSCLRETTFKPVIKYTENFRYCNCPSGRIKTFEKIAPTIDEITSLPSLTHIHASNSQTTREWYPTINYALSDKSTIELSTNWETDDSLSQHETNRPPTESAKQLSSLTTDNLAKFDSVNKTDEINITDICKRDTNVILPTDVSQKYIPNIKDTSFTIAPVDGHLNLTSLDSEYEKFMEAVWPEVIEETNDNLNNHSSTKDNTSKTTGSTVSKNLEISSNSESFKEFFGSTVVTSKSNIQNRDNSVDKSVVSNNGISEKDNNSQDTCYNMDSASVVNGGSVISNKIIEVVNTEKLTENSDSLEWKNMGSEDWSGDSETDDKKTKNVSTPSSLKLDKKRKGHAKVSSRQRKAKVIVTKKIRRRSNTTTSSDPDDETSLTNTRGTSNPSISSSDTETSSSSSESTTSSSSSSSSESTTSSSDSSSDSSDSSFDRKKTKGKKKRSHSKKKKHRKALLKTKKNKKKLTIKLKKLKMKKKKLKLLTKKREKLAESEEHLHRKAIMVKLEKSIAKSEKQILKGKEKEKKMQYKIKLARKKSREASRKKKKRHNKKSENESSSLSSDSSSTSDTEDDSSLSSTKLRKRKNSIGNEGSNLSKKKRTQLNSTDTNDDMDDDDLDVSFDMETVRNIKRERISDEEAEALPPSAKQQFSPRLKKTNHQIISVNELHSDFIESNRRNEDSESHNTATIKMEPELTKTENIVNPGVVEPQIISLPTLENKPTLDTNKDSINNSVPLEDEEESSSSSSEGSSSNSDFAKDESVDMFHDDILDNNVINHSPVDEISEHVFEKIPIEIEDIVRLRKPLGKLLPAKTDAVVIDTSVKENEMIESDEIAAAEELKKQFDMVENYSTSVKRQIKHQAPCDVRPIPSLSAAVPIPQTRVTSMTGEIKWDWRPEVYPSSSEPKPRKPSRWGMMTKADDLPLTTSSVSTLIEVQLKSESEIHLPSSKTSKNGPALSEHKQKSADKHHLNKPQMIPGLESSYKNNEVSNDDQNNTKNRVYQIQTISTIGSVASEEFTEDRLEAYDEDEYEMMGTEVFGEPKNEDEHKVALERRRHFQNQAKTISLDDRISMVLQHPPGTKLTNGDVDPAEPVETLVEKEAEINVVEASPEKGILILAGIRITRTDPRVLKVKRVCFADGLAPGQDSDCEENIQPSLPKKQKISVEQRKLRKKVGGHAYPCPVDWADYHPHWDTLPPPPPPPGSPPHHLYSKPCNIASLAGISEQSEGLITRLPRIPSHNETLTV